MWKYLAIWLGNLGISVLATIGEAIPPPSDGLIKAAYDWSSGLAAMSDRALWLFFLGVILYAAWWNDKRKEKQLERYRAMVDERLAKAVVVMERLERWLNERSH